MQTDFLSFEFVLLYDIGEIKGFIKFNFECTLFYFFFLGLINLAWGFNTDYDLKFSEFKVYIGFCLSYRIELVFNDTKDCDDLLNDNTGSIFLLLFMRLPFFYYGYSFFVITIPTFFYFNSCYLFQVVLVKYFYFNFLLSIFIFYEFVSFYCLLIWFLFLDKLLLYITFWLDFSFLFYEKNCDIDLDYCEFLRDFLLFYEYKGNNSTLYKLFMLTDA